MPKLKTHKATLKRFRRSGKGKILRRRAGQDHFNARESGKITRNKRRDVLAHETNLKAIRKLTPYS
ncbi:50S ribosomal protein L35 [Candidatus Parcubacteria bacterium]|jgi:large subunit ribosomal protein L35|nr:MAG: 50S ribosomal protein L35 [Candidatus Parcubacteria bacterium]